MNATTAVLLVRGSDPHPPLNGATKRIPLLPAPPQRESWESAMAERLARSAMDRDIDRIKTDVKSAQDAGVSIDARWEGLTPFCRALRAQRFEICNYLVKEGADPDARQYGKVQLTPFMLTARGGYETAALYLTKQLWTINLEARTPGGWRAVHYAARFANPDILNIALTQCAEPHPQTLSGLTPLKIAKNELETIGKYFPGVRIYRKPRLEAIVELLESRS